MQRRAVPPIALAISGGTALAIVLLAFPTLRVHGVAWYFREGDSYLFRATALDPFGKGRSFALVGRITEVPYRYGRIGLPLLGWVFALGRPALVPWSLIVVNLVAIAAIPGLAAVLLDEYGAPAIAGALVLLSPGLLLIRDYVFAEPLLIALVLLANILEARGCSRPAVAVLAYAVLVKEVAALALLPWIWRGLRRRDLRDAARYVGALVPYAAWSVWLRIRVGEFPFLAHTMQRTQALTWPGNGIHEVLVRATPDHAFVVAIVSVTILLCVIGAVVVRGTPLGFFTAALAVYTACLGPNALRYEAETLRLLTVPQVFAFLCIVIGRTVAQPAMPRRGARNRPV